MASPRVTRTMSCRLAVLLCVFLATSHAARPDHRREHRIRELKQGNPHARPATESLMATRLSLSTVDDTASITSDVHVIHGLSGKVTVSWEGVTFGSNGDWIGVYAMRDNLTVFTSPLKFKYAFSDPYDCKYLTTKAACQANPVCSWSTSCVPASTLPSNGSVSFLIQNMRQPVFFAYVTGNIQYPELRCVSKPVTFTNIGASQGSHIALGEGGDPTTMNIYWQGGQGLTNPGVKYGLASQRTQTNKVHYVAAYANPGRQYEKSDLCDITIAPAGRQGWLWPGVLLSVTLKDLLPGERYWYSYGDDAYGYSDDRFFTAAPLPGPGVTTTVAVFGDMGQADIDGSKHHSWDFNDRGEYPSLNTTALLEKDKESEFVLHIGDISYAVGYLSEWDNFFWQIEPVASNKPWMTAIGNHEMGYSGSYIPGSDSGGECGVPYNAFFPFASQDPHSVKPFQDRQPWYSFEYGNVAYVVMSTEHDFTTGSDQWNYLRDALSAVNRERTPWLVFTGHRPMYVDSSFHSDTSVSELLVKHVEPLMLKYRVNIALWGHNHSYQRLCAVKNFSCADDGIRHLVVGMAGYDHTTCPNDSSKLTELCNDSIWGYVRMHFGHEEATFQFLSDEDGSVVDTFSLQL